MKTKRIVQWIVVLVVMAATSSWAAPGTIEGRITSDDGSGMGGVTVVVVSLDKAQISDADGFFLLSGVPEGTYELSFTLEDNALTRSDVDVEDGQTATVDLTVDWQVSFFGAITVTSASRQAERIVDAPSAVTLISAEEIERQAAHGQIPKLLEFTPGVEITQSGIYDFNLNTRGFNSSLNRRVATLIDGRNPAVPFLGAQEWAAISFPLDDMASMELVRGPSAALYGANASSGVLNIVTKAPRFSQGGQVRVTGGELSTFNADLRWAGQLGNGGWYYKILGGVRDHGDFTVSRNGAAEYSVPCNARAGIVTDCLPQEAVPLDPENADKIAFGALRIDKYFDGGSLLTLEGGNSSIEGPAFQTGIGRVQLVDIERPWARANFSTVHWNVLGSYNRRDASDQTALASGTRLVLDTESVQFEAQGNWDFAKDKGRVVVGGSYKDEDIDSLDPATGAQTLIFEPVGATSGALFGQLDWAATDKLKVVIAGRWDTSDLHDNQFSPKASLVYSLADDQTLRLTYNEAFQVPNYSEFFLQGNVAAPVDLSAIEGICLIGGVSCGFAPGPTRILAVGNENLEVEEVQMWEVGYSAIINNRAFVTIDYYNSQNDNFITDLIPQLGTSLGRVNSNFGPYTPPADLDPGLQALLLATLQGALGPSFFILSNNFDGTPIFAAASYTNFGKVDTQGIDVGINYYINDAWNLSGSYSWFDFEIQDSDPSLENILQPNTPENKFSVGIGWVSGGWAAGLSGRWVDDFRWAVGPFQGTVESYFTADLNVNYEISDNWSAGINWSNVFDEVHYESFGGDLLGSRLLANVAFGW